MKIKEGFVLRKLMDQYVVVALSNEASELNYLIKLNSVGAFMWEALQKEDLSFEELVSKVCDEYDAPSEVIRKDVDAFINVLEGKNILKNGR